MISTAELAKKKFTGLTLPAPYGDLLGKIPYNVSGAIWGPKGSGKSTMAVDLAYVLASQLGTGIYCSSEEGPGPSMQNKIERLGAEHDDLMVTGFDGLDDLRAAVKYSGAKFVILDSASMGYVKLAEFEEFHAWCKGHNVMLWYILHATKDGRYKGNTMMVHMPDIEIKVAGGLAVTEKNRFKETPREMKVTFSRNGRPAEEVVRENPVDQSLLYGIEFIENPGPELRENRGVSPDEIYQMITDMVLNTIEEVGHLPWQKEWKDTGLGDGRVATNFESKKPYRGINAILLNFEQKWSGGKPILVPKKFVNPYFMTFNQVDERGGKIKKGSRGYRVVYFTKLYKYRNPEKDVDFGTYSFQEMVEWIRENPDKLKDRHKGMPPEQVARNHYLPILKYYNVFNGEDIEGIDWGELPENQNADLPEEDKIAVGEAIYQHYPTAPEVLHKDSSAYYVPDGDFINMPAPASFTEPQFYYTTLFHEAIHSTGHESRLGRKIRNRKGSTGYAKEELVAEMGAVYLCAESGILFKTLENSAKYLRGWNSRIVKEMKKDNRFFFRAASRAQEAADYILDRDDNGIPAYRTDLDNSTSGREPKPVSQSDVKVAYGKETTVDFKADGSIQQAGRYALMEVDALIPSHNKDCTPNSGHTISKGQPRDRSLDALCSQPKFIAQHLNPTSITRGNLAFNGASSVLPDGQVIQGNGRGIALKIAKDEHPKKYQQYKQYLIDNAADWGLSKSDITKFSSPALVRVLDVPEQRAIALGNVVDTSQAKMSKVDQGKAYIRNLSRQRKQAIGKLINDSPGETLGQVIDDVGLRIMDQFKDLDRQELVKENGLTSEGKDFLRSVFAGLVFDSEANKHALQHFLKLKHTQRAGLERAYGHIIPFIGTEADLTPTLQKAVEIVAQIQNTEGIDTVQDFMNQSDAFSGSNSDRFSTEEAGLARFLLAAGTQKAIRNGFRMYQWKVSGREDLFNPIKKVSPGQAFTGAFVKGERVNPPEELVKLYTPAHFKKGDIVRDYYDDAKYQYTSKRKGTYYFKNLKTGKREKFSKNHKRFLPGRKVTPTLPLFEFRKNPAGPLIYIGTTERVIIDTGNGQKALEGEFPSFLSQDKLYIVPAWRVESVQDKVYAPAAYQSYQEWHDFEADATDFAIDWPDERAQPAGTAVKIWYASDKMMQPGDRKGRLNHYVHSFDAGKRPAVVKGDILIIGNIGWNRRGLLN